MIGTINSIRAKLTLLIFLGLITGGISLTSIPLLAEEVEEVIVEEEDLSYKEMLHRDKLKLKELQAEQKRRDKLNIIKKKEERREIRSQTSALIREGKIAYSKRQYDAAREAFYSILDIDPQNKTALNYLKLIRTRIDREKEIALKRKTENLYRQGIRSYKKKEYESAIDSFLQVNNLIPDYKKANYYLDLSERAMKKQRFREEELGIEPQGGMIEREVDIEEVVEEEVEMIEPQEEEAVIEEKEEMQIKEKVILQQVAEKEEASRQEEIEALLDEAKDLYSGQMNNAARAKFEEVLAIDAGNREALNYIEILEGKREIEELGAEEQEVVVEEETIAEIPEVRAEGMYDAALSLYKKRDYESAREVFIDLNGFYPNYKKTVYYLTKIDKILEDERKKKEALISKEQRRKKREQINEIAREAKSLYRNKEYDSAKEKYQQILEIDETDKSAKKYIKVIDARIKEEEMAVLRDQTEGVYREALTLYKKRNYTQAKDKFLKVNELYAGYKKTDAYLQKIDRIIQKEEKSAEKEPSQVKEAKSEETPDPAVKKKDKKGLAAKAEPIYQEAMQLYEQKKYDLARDRFLDVNDIGFDYKRTNYYLGKIEKALLEELDEKIKYRQEKVKVQEKKGYIDTDKAQDLEEATQKIRAEYEAKADKLRRQWEEEFLRKEQRVKGQEVSGEIISEEEVTEARDVFLDEQPPLEEYIEVDAIQDTDREDVIAEEETVDITKESDADIDLREVKENIEKAKSRYKEAGMLLEEVEEGLGEMEIEEREIRKRIEAMGDEEESVEEDDEMDLYEAKKRIERAKKTYEQAGRMIDELDAQIQALPEDKETAEEVTVKDIERYGEVDIEEEVTLDDVKSELEKTKESYKEVEDILDSIDEELGVRP